jgi:hypothetical protein
VITAFRATTTETELPNLAIYDAGVAGDGAPMRDGATAETDAHFIARSTMSSIRFWNLARQSMHDEEVRRLFAALSGWWHEATDFLSSPSEKVTHPAYRQIIDAGEPMIPHILADLREHGGDWYAALREITNENPVGPEHRGRTELMTEDWLAWARSRESAS